MENRTIIEKNGARIVKTGLRFTAYFAGMRPQTYTPEQIVSVLRGLGMKDKAIREALS